MTEEEFTNILNKWTNTDLFEISDGQVTPKFIIKSFLKLLLHPFTVPNLRPTPLNLDILK